MLNNNLTFAPKPKHFLSDIITEALKSYIAEQKEKMFYENFEQSAKELKNIFDGKADASELTTLDALCR